MAARIQVQLYGYENHEAWLSSHIIDNIEELKHSVSGLLNTKATYNDFENIIETLGFSLHASCSSDHSGYVEKNCVLITKTNDIVILDKRESDVSLACYAKSKESADKLFEEVKLRFDPQDPSSDRIKFAFWQSDDDGCDVRYTKLTCPELSEINSNYSPKIIKEVLRIGGLERPYQHGKIMLWHGPPGNGKTFLIRSFARFLAENHDILPEVIIDPEMLFSTPKYLTSLLLRRPENRIKQKFRLFIAEDCAQLFATDCRNHEGFSRLLNTADGLIGQDQNLIFLFTANESIEEIDPAILRPGRCLQNLEIPNWSKQHAAQWLQSKNKEEYLPKLKTSNSLADLYAMVNGVIPATNHRDEKIGF